MFQEKQKQCQEKLQIKLDQPDGEKKKGTEKEIISLQKKLAMNGELLDLACLSYQTVLEKEKCTKREMQQLSEALQQQIVSMARDKLIEAFDLLDEMAWSNKLSMYILEKVRAIDCQYAAEQLYKHICKAYMFPDPEEWNIRTGFHAELEDPSLLSSDYCRNKGECIGLMDVEEPGCPKATRTPDKAEIFKRESIHGQQRQSPRLHETSTPPCNKYRLGRKEAEERNSDAKKNGCADNLKDTRTHCSTDILHSSQNEQGLNTPRQRHHSSEDYRRELKNLEDCWNKDFSPELRNTPRHLRWRAKATNDELSPKRDKPVESSELTSSARLLRFQIETQKTSNSGTKIGTDMQAVFSDEWRTSRSRTEGSTYKRKSQRIEMNTTPVGKQRTKRTINFYDSYAETRPVLQDKTSVNYESGEQSNGNNGDGNTLKKNWDQIKTEMYIIEKGHNSNEQHKDLTVKMKRCKRWNDDGEYYQYKRRKKLRSEITKEELWEGFPLNVCFKRQPLKPKSIKCTEIGGRDKTEVVVRVCAPKGVSFNESNKSGNASTDINRSGTSMAAKHQTYPDREAKMGKLSHDADIAHIDGPVYEFHKGHAIINVSLNTNTNLDGDSDLNASEEDALLADSKSNLSHSVTSAVSEIDSATEMELLQEDSKKLFTAAKYTKTDLTNLPENADAMLLEMELCTLSFHACVKHDLPKHVKTCVGTKYKLNCNRDNAGVEVLVDANESNISIKETTAESNNDSNSNQTDISLTEGVKERSFKCIGGYTCSCNKHKENTTHLLNRGEVIDILAKVEHIGVNIGYKSEETISHDATNSKIHGESVVEDLSGYDKKTTITMGGIEESSNNTHKQCHVTPTVCELIQESEIESGLKVISAKNDIIHDVMQRRTPSKKRKRSGADVITPKRSARLQEKSMRTPLKGEFCVFTRIKSNDQSLKKVTAAPCVNHPNSKLDVEDNNVEDLHVEDPAVHSEVDLRVPSVVNDEAVSMRNSATSRNTQEQKIEIDSVPKEIYLDIRSAERMRKDNHDLLHCVNYTGDETVLTKSSKVPINDVKLASEDTKIHPSITEMDEEAIKLLSKNGVVKDVTRIKKSKLFDECDEEGFSSDNNKGTGIASQCIMNQGKSKKKTLCKKGQKRSMSEAKLKFNETENIVSEPKELIDSAIEDKKVKLCNLHQESNSKEDGDTINLKPNDWKEKLGRSSTRIPAKNSRQIDVISGYSDDNPSNKNKVKVKKEATFLNKPLKFSKDFQNHSMEVNQKELPERILRHKKCSVVQDSAANISIVNYKNQQSNEKKSEQFNIRIIDNSEKAKHNANTPKGGEFELNGSISSHSDNLYLGNKLPSATLSGIKESNAISSTRKELHDAECLQSVVAKWTDDNVSPSQYSSIRSSKSNKQVTSQSTITYESRSTLKALTPEEESSSTRSTTHNIFNKFCELFPDIIPKTNCVDTDIDKKCPSILSQSSPSSSSNANDPDASNRKRSNRSKGPNKPKKHCELNATSNTQFDPKVALNSLCLTSESDYDSDVECEYPITESRSDHSYSASSCDLSAGNTDKIQAPEIKRRIKMKFPFKCRSKNALIRDKLNFAFGQQSRKMKETVTKAHEIFYDKNKMSTRSSENAEQNESAKTKVQIASGVLDKKKCNRTPNKASNGRKDDRCQNYGIKKPSPSTSARRKSNEKKAKDADDLLYNSMLEKHACVLWSSEHRRHYQLTRPDATPSEVDQLLRKDWETLSLREKHRYLERARYALRDENKPTKYKRKKPHDTPKEVKAEEDYPKPNSRMMDKFLGMSPGIQLTEIKKWLHFYHEVSPDEYASVMTRFKQALKDKKSKFKSYEENANKSSELYDRTVDGQAKYRRLLFEKMLESRERIINLFTEKRAIQKKFLLDNFNSTVKKLIAGEEVGFVRGIKSERLTDVLNDLRSLESARKIGVSGEPIGTKSFENLANQLHLSHYWDNSLDASLCQDVYDVFENHPSEDVDLIKQFVLETDSSEVPNVDPATIEALLGVEDHCSYESPRCIFFQNVPCPNPDDMGNCRSFQGTRPIYSNADSASKNYCPSSILTDWIVSDYITAMENQDGRLRPNEHNGDWTVLTRDSPWQLALNHKQSLVSQSSGGYTRYPFYLTIPSTPVQDFIRQPSPRMQDQNIPHSYIPEKRNINASVSDSDRNRLVCGKKKDRELQIAWYDDTRWIHGSQGIQVENSVYKRPMIKIDCSQMHLGSSILYSVADTTK